MAINKYWLNRPKYSIYEAAYLACGLEPQDPRDNHPLVVIKVLSEMLNHIEKQYPSVRRLPTFGFTVGYDFVRSWANHIGETEFFKLESETKKTSKNLF